jgi:hypothetical protein
MTELEEIKGVPSRINKHLFLNEFDLIYILQSHKKNI